MLKREKLEVTIRKRLEFLVTFEPLRNRAEAVKKRFDEELRGDNGEEVSGFEYHRVVEIYFGIANSLWKEYRGIS